MVLRERNTIEMVAEYWGVSPGSVRRLVENGTLEAIRLGRIIRISREQVEACEAVCNTKTALDQDRERADHFRMNRALQLALETTRRQRIKK